MKTSQLITIQDCTSVITTRVTLTPPSSHCLLTKKRVCNQWWFYCLKSLQHHNRDTTAGISFTLCARGYYTEEIRRKVAVLELFSWKMCNNEIHVSQISCKMQENLLVLQKGQFSFMLSEIKTSMSSCFFIFYTTKEKSSNCQGLWGEQTECRGRGPKCRQWQTIIL